MSWQTTVTLEYETGDPECFRETIVDSEPDEAARKAVFRALKSKPRPRYASVVIVLDRIGGPNG